jgi:hypothetical protein
MARYLGPTIEPYGPYAHRNNPTHCEIKMFPWSEHEKSSNRPPALDHTQSTPPCETGGRSHLLWIETSRSATLTPHHMDPRAGSLRRFPTFARKRFAGPVGMR